MKISIEKELEKSSLKEKKKFEPLNEVKLLLESNETEKTRILRGLSQNSQINRVEKVVGKQLELEKLENSYDGRVYDISQIKNLCMDYNLRFLSSQFYTGIYDVEVAGKILEFSTKTNTNLTEYELKNSFFIMAPEEMFALKDEKYITKRQLDPAIFYKIDNQHYRLIHKWGDDFTVFRLLSGIRNRSWWHFQIFNTFATLPVVALLLAVIFGGLTWLNYPITFTSASLLTSFTFSYFRWGWGRHDEGDEIEGFFNPHNWNDSSKIKR